MPTRAAQVRMDGRKKESFTRWALSAVATPGTSSSFFIFFFQFVGGGGHTSVPIVCGSLLLDPQSLQYALTIAPIYSPLILRFSFGHHGSTHEHKNSPGYSLQDVGLYGRPPKNYQFRRSSTRYSRQPGRHPAYDRCLSTLIFFSHRKWNQLLFFGDFLF